MAVNPQNFPVPTEDLAPGGTAKAVLAGGCFWCTEAVFLLLDGVLSVRPGYAGGTAETANYRAVCSGDTGHAEAIEIVYDSAKITFGQILRVFFSVAHDPTQLNRQGADVGPQYRSAIFYANDAERRVSETYIRQIDQSGVLGAPVVTSLEPLEQFFPAEAYHHDYAGRNPNQPYICAVSDPKVKKLKDAFPKLLKRNDKTGIDQSKRA